MAKPSYCHLLVPPVIYQGTLCKILCWFNLDTFTQSENITKIKTTSYEVFKGTLETQTKSYFIYIHTWCIRGNLLPPANEVCGGNVFIPVCHTVHGVVGFPACITGHMTRGVCIQEGSTSGGGGGGLHPR